MDLSLNFCITVNRSFTLKVAVCSPHMIWGDIFGSLRAQGVLQGCSQPKANYDLKSENNMILSNYDHSRSKVQVHLVKTAVSLVCHMKAHLVFRMCIEMVVLNHFY